MHRQFANGSEKDVARWLKEMGYRGQGLKKEHLQPLCKGAMREIWEGLIEHCRPEESVRDMKRAVERRVQRRAAAASRQLSKESTFEMHRRRRRIAELERQLIQQETEIERSKLQVTTLQGELMKLEGSYGKQKGSMQNTMEKAKILEGASIKMEAASGSMERDMQHLEKHNARMKAALTGENDSTFSTAAFDDVMRSMHGCTRKHLMETCQSTTASVEEMIPKLDGTDDSRLLSEIGKLYAHNNPELIQRFAMACERAQSKAAQYEAKYRTGRRWQGWDDTLQMTALMEMQTRHIKAFLAFKQLEDRMQQGRNSIKSTAAVQQFQSAIEKAGYLERFNRRLECQCLQAEVECLKMEMERLESEAMGDERSVNHVRDAYRQLKRRVEQQHQIDRLIIYLMGQLQQLRLDFSEMASDVTDKLENELQPIARSCLGALRLCEDAMGKEFETFCRYDLAAQSKCSTSATSGSCAPSERLLQRWDAAVQNAAASEVDTYWTASIKTLFGELKLTAPLMSVESPDGAFFRASDALLSATCNAYLSRSLKQQRTHLITTIENLNTEKQNTIQKDEERDTQMHRSMTEVDTMVEQGHGILRQLQSDIPQAMTAFKDAQAFSSVPWIERDNQGIQDWIIRDTHR